MSDPPKLKYTCIHSMHINNILIKLISMDNTRNKFIDDDELSESTSLTHLLNKIFFAAYRITVILQTRYGACNTPPSRQREI